MVFEKKKKKKRKNDSRYPSSWVRDTKGDPVKFFHFPFFNDNCNVPMSSTVRIEIVKTSLFSRTFRLTMGDFVREF